MSSRSFVQAAERVYIGMNLLSCIALMNTNASANQVYGYRQMFQHDVREYPRNLDQGWWNVSWYDTEYQNARIYALLLAGEMHVTGDL